MFFQQYTYNALAVVSSQGIFFNILIVILDFTTYLIDCYITFVPQVFFDMMYDDDDERF